MPSEWVWAAQTSTPAWTWIFVSAGISGKKKVTRATSSCYCLYFWFNFFSPWRFWFHRFVLFCLGLIGLAFCFCFFFNCCPSSHFVFSILSLEAMSRPAVGTPLSPIGPTAALSLQLTLRPLNISMFQVGAGTVCVSVSCHSVECSLCNFCLVSIVSCCLPWGAPAGFGTACSWACWEEQWVKKWRGLIGIVVFRVCWWPVSWLWAM